MSRFSIVMVLAGCSTVFLAALTIWLLLTEPVALATAVSGRDVTALAEAIGDAILEGLRQLARYL